MQATAAIPESRASLTETISTLLRSKGNEVVSVSVDSTVFEAVEKMAENHIGALLVFDGNRLSGIVSERDYARKVILKGRHSHDTQVREIMSSPVHSVTPERTVDECLCLMTKERIRHLPIVENEKVLGLVSMGDLVKWIISSQSHTIHHLQNYIAGEYPC